LRGVSDDGPREPGESEHARLNRELIELLNELRVALPGVQVLFAFLLAVPFQQRFGRTTAFQRDVYFATLCLAFVATALLIAPSALHRLNFRMHDKSRIVFASNRLLIAGLGVLGLALIGVLLLIADVLFGGVAGAVAAGLGALVLLVLWLALPLGAREP
jgi:predicted neutral ceramidase superfamily lipid hydrolase